LKVNVVLFIPPFYRNRPADTRVRPRRIAEEIGRNAGAEAHEIVDLVPRGGFIGFMKSGRQSVRRDSTPITDPGVDLSVVDTVVLVHPVWASNVCPPIRTWLNAHKTGLAGKKIGLAVSNKGSDGAPIRAKFEEEFGPLAAFAVIPEDLAPEERARILGEFHEAIRGRR
jgi:hypothetical protein